MAFDPKTSKWAGRLTHYGAQPLTTGRRILEYGYMGSGKSTLAGSAPKPFFLDADYGENVSTREGGYPVFYIFRGNAFEDTKALLTNCLLQKDVFDPDGGPLADRETVAVDSWTKINELMLLDICKADGIDLESEKPGFNQYGKLKFRQIILIGLLKEINLKRGLNVIVTALPMLEGAEDEKLTQDSNDKNYDRIVGCPNLVGAYRKVIGAEFEEVYYMERIQGPKPIFRLHTSVFNNFQAKSRLGLPGTIDNPTFGSLMAMAQKAAQPAPATPPGRTA